MPDYIERSFFEILVNSLVHRDYLVNGSEVHIDIFDDRLTIYSPGGMPNGEFIQNSSIKDTPSIRRNPVLADIFHRLGYMERQGSGLNKIVEGYRHAVNYSLEKEPIFYSNNSQFTVTLKNLNEQTAFFSEMDTLIQDELPTIEKKILYLLIKNPSISQRDITSYVGKSKSTIQRHLLSLSDKNLIERVGSKMRGYWSIRK